MVIFWCSLAIQHKRLKWGPIDSSEDKWRLKLYSRTTVPNLAKNKHVEIVLNIVTPLPGCLCFSSWPVGSEWDTPSGVVTWVTPLFNSPKYPPFHQQEDILANPTCCLYHLGPLYQWVSCVTRPCMVSLNNNRQINILIITKTDSNLKITQIIPFNPQFHSMRLPFNQLANSSLRMQLTYLMYDFRAWVPN